MASVGRTRPLTLTTLIARVLLFLIHSCVLIHIYMCCFCWHLTAHLAAVWCTRISLPPSLSFVLCGAQWQCVCAVQGVLRSVLGGSHRCRVHDRASCGQCQFQLCCCSANSIMCSVCYCLCLHICTFPILWSYDLYDTVCFAD